MKIGAVIITYYPDNRFLERFNVIKNQVDEVVIVDNTKENPPDVLTDIQKGGLAYIIFNKRNLGLAYGLNTGISILKEKGYHWALLFDQDSIPAETMVEQLLRTYYNYSQKEKIAIISPQRVDIDYPNIYGKWIFPRKYSFNMLYKTVRYLKEDAEVPWAITSGSLLNIDIWKKQGGFCDFLFIDYIDIEYCLRSVKDGYKIIVSSSARLYHRLGERKSWSFFYIPLMLVIHKPYRRYFFYRNFVYVFKKYYYSFPYCMLYEIFNKLTEIMSILVYENQKLKNIKYVILGISHGLISKWDYLPAELR